MKDTNLRSNELSMAKIDLAAVCDIINYLNEKKVVYNLVDECEQIRIELEFSGLHIHYIVIEEDVVHINQIPEITMSQLKSFIEAKIYVEQFDKKHSTK